MISELYHRKINGTTIKPLLEIKLYAKFNLMKKSFFSLFILLSCPLLLCSCACLGSPKLANFSDPNSPRYVQLEIAQPPAEPDKKIIKVVSYNINLCKKIGSVLKLLRETPHLAQADIICLQEMNLEGVKFLSAALKYNYVYYPSAIHPENNQDFGQAILSKWPLKNDRKILLPASFKDRYLKIQRCAIGAQVLIHNLRITVFSAHLGVMISPPDRIEQLRTVIAAIPANSENCIIAGDFNTYARIHTQAVTRILKENGFLLATENTGWTYKYWYLLNYKTALDYIFYKGLRLIKAGKINDRQGSDHLPVWAVFAF